MDYDNGKTYEGSQLLSDFEIPIEKTPLFVGGTGFVVEQEGESLKGRIYPINNKADIIFWHTDGKSKSQISIDIKNWDNLSIVNSTTGEKIAFELIRHAYQFDLKPGNNYQIN